MKTILITVVSALVNFVSVSALGTTAIETVLAKNLGEKVGFTALTHTECGVRVEKCDAARCYGPEDFDMAIWIDGSGHRSGNLVTYPDTASRWEWTLDQGASILSVQPYKGPGGNGLAHLRFDPTSLQIGSFSFDDGNDSCRF